MSVADGTIESRGLVKHLRAESRLLARFVGLPTLSELGEVFYAASYVGAILSRYRLIC